MTVNNRKNVSGAYKNRKRRLLSLVLFLAVFAVYSVTFTVLFGHACPLALVFGVPCPACGMTRAVLLLCRGDFSGAFSMHPLVYSLPLLVLLLLPSAFSERYARSKFLTVSCVVFIVLFIGVYLYRMIALFPAEEPMTLNENSLLFLLKRLLTE